MGNIYTKEGLLFLAQVDHLSGEILGSAIEYLYAAGARNVQILPSVTKKNRPGQAILIDAPPARSDDIERVISEELGSTGWHRFKTEHRHQPVETVTKLVPVEIGSVRFNFELRGKRIKNQAGSVRPEHSSCLELQKALSERAGTEMPLRHIFTRSQNILNQATGESTVLNFEPDLERS